MPGSSIGPIVMMVHDTLLKRGNAALRSGNPQAAIQHYLQAARLLEGAPSSLTRMLEGNLELARQHHLRQRKAARRRGESSRVAVCGWLLASNSAGRVLTLADAYHRKVPEVEIIGALLPKWGSSLWPPMQGLETPCHAIVVEDEARFIAKAVQLVAAHPYDLIHLSKPRFPNLVFGLLYQLVWGAKVVWDIDDEELGFVEATEPLAFHEALDEQGRLPPLEQLHRAFWTRLTVGQVSRFAAVTVSNPALQARYGGEVIPHVRDEAHFVPSQDRRSRSRRRWGVPQDVKVVLFFGTPRRHKGLLQTARALASLGRDDIWFVIVGDFPDESLKQELQAIEGVQCRFIEGQPYRSTPDVVAMGDYTVLLQEADSLTAEFQLPAKLVDALAMGLIVFAHVTPATRWLEEAGAITPVTPETLAAALSAQLGEADEAVQRQHNRSVFLEQLSLQASAGVITTLLKPTIDARAPGWDDKLLPLVASFNGGSDAVATMLSEP